MLPWYLLRWDKICLRFWNVEIFMLLHIMEKCLIKLEVASCHPHTLTPTPFLTPCKKKKSVIKIPHSSTLTAYNYRLHYKYDDDDNGTVAITLFKFSPHAFLKISGLYSRYLQFIFETWLAICGTCCHFNKQNQVFIRSTQKLIYIYISHQQWQVHISL